MDTFVSIEAGGMGQSRPPNCTERVIGPTAAPWWASKAASWILVSGSPLETIGYPRPSDASSADTYEPQAGVDVGTGGTQESGGESAPKPFRGSRIGPSFGVGPVYPGN